MRNPTTVRSFIWQMAIASVGVDQVKILRFSNISCRVCD